MDGYVLLTVESERGFPVPAIGDHRVISGRFINAYVDLPVAGLAGTRYVCAGWTGTGSAPASGSTNSFTFCVTQDSSITWLWKTQYQLTTSVSPLSSGTVTGIPEGPWYDADTNAELSAIASGGYVLSNWSGDLSGNKNPETLTMDRPRIVTANFVFATICVDGANGDDSNDGLSWSTAVKTIQQGLDLAGVTGWTVLVADGTYVRSGDKNLDFKGKGIHLKSVGGAGNCIIDCGKSARAFYFHSSERSSAIVEGFAIRNGSGGYGGGIYCTDTSSPMIRNCIITECSASSGGAIYCYHSSPTITNCTLVNNTAGEGGAIYCENYSGPMVTNCTISNNIVGSSGGGIHCEGISCITIINCTITDNRVTGSYYGGGGIYCANVYSQKPTVTIVNCIIADNSAKSGGGVLSWGSTVTMTNCTLANNSSTQDGGAIWCREGSALSLDNTILWGNTATASGNQIYTWDENTILSLNYCDYANGTNDIAGSGTVTPNNCINADPVFLCLLSSNYRLEEQSPCIDIGNNSYLPGNITSDLDGCSRIENNVVDIGAYEYRFVQSPPFANFTAVPKSGAIPVAVNFMDLSGGSITLREWDFDNDGVVDSNTRYPVHIYPFPGTYTVKLKVSGPGGSDSEVRTGYITITPGSEYCWTHRIGGSDSDYASAVCVDGSGNVYVAGYYRASVNFAADWGGNDTRSGPGCFVTKIGTNNNYLWTRKMGGTVSAMCLDGSGNLYMTGTFYQGSSRNFAEDWGGNDLKTSAGLDDVFIMKVNANGSYGWTRRIGGTASDYVSAICADTSGNVYVAGSFESTTVNFAADWGQSEVKTRTGSRDAFIMKINADGSYGWARRIGGTGISGVCTDISGNIYVTGGFTGTINFAEDWGGNETKTSASGCSDVFVTRIAADGNYAWTHRLGGVGDDSGGAICADGNGNVYVAGYFCGHYVGGEIVNFAEDWEGSDIKTGWGLYDSFITRIDANGNYAWAHIIGGSDWDFISDIRTDATGKVYLTGSFEEVVNFAEDWDGADSRTTKEGAWSDIFVMMVDSNGDYGWVRRMGGWDEDYPYAMCVDGNGNIFVAGLFNSGFNFAEDWMGSDVKTTLGFEDAFIMKIRQQ
jgi:PKD repeat protein